jgi:hypothetical protein
MFNLKVKSTLDQRPNLNSTLIQRCFNVVYLLEIVCLDHSNTYYKISKKSRIFVFIEGSCFSRQMKLGNSKNAGY